MGKLRLSVAMGDYDRTRALLDGRVLIDGVEPVYMTLSPEETFFRAMRQQAFDISELSLSSYLVKASRGECPYVAVPVFLSRAFRHTSIWVRKDRIRTPAGSEGQARRRARVPAHRQRVGARDPAGRPRRAPARHHLGARRHRDAGAAGEDRPAAATRGAARGCARRPHDLRAARRAARSMASSRRARRPARRARNPQVRWLFDDPTAAAKDWYRRTGIFPIMHVVGVRRGAGRAAPVAAGGGAEGLHAGQGARHSTRWPTPRPPR